MELAPYFTCRAPLAYFDWPHPYLARYESAVSSVLSPLLFFWTDLDIGEPVDLRELVVCVSAILARFGRSARCDWFGRRCPLGQLLSPTSVCVSRAASFRAAVAFLFRLFSPLRSVAEGNPTLFTETLELALSPIQSPCWVAVGNCFLRIGSPFLFVRMLIL